MLLSAGGSFARKLSQDPNKHISVNAARELYSSLFELGSIPTYHLQEGAILSTFLSNQIVPFIRARMYRPESTVPLK